mgnify:CR=1 FL=1
METLRKYMLPCSFKPVARLCAKIEYGLFAEFKSLMKLHEKSYLSILDDMDQDTNDIQHDIQHDVEFIVNLQNELGIANSTPQETAEWYTTLTIIGNIENYKKCQIEYEEYIKTLINCPPSVLTKIINVKNEILTMYQYYVFGMTWQNIKDFLATTKGLNFYYSESDLKWSCEGAHICKCKES